MTKKDLVDHLDEFHAPGSLRKSIVSYTGGTTGSSLKVLYSRHDVQERQAVLDLFREQFGWYHGAPTAWFSGKSFLSAADRKHGRYTKLDYLTNTLYVSTFDISTASAESIVSDLRRHGTRFIVGFPSSIGLLMRSEAWAIDGPPIRTIFPTAETVLPAFRRLVAERSTARVVDQYASSEGAPFITECALGALHINHATGIFEVVGSDGRPALEGELLVTSFTTTTTH